MNFTNTWGFLALMGIPVILLLYILKQRFKPYNVGSMALWNKILETSDGHRWRQRLRNNLLMALQIAAVILLAVALARPFIAAVGQRDNMVLILDSSMSMQAVDESPSRIEKARQDMTEMIENAPEGTFFTVVDFCDIPYTLTTLTQDKSTALKAVSSISAKETGADTEGLRNILDSFSMGDTASVYLYTDRNYDLGIDGMTTAVYGQGGVNYAVNLMSEKDGYVLMKISSYGGGGGCTAALFADGVIIDSREVVFGDRDTADVVFDIQGMAYNTLTGKILDEDILAADNVFYLANNGRMNLNALLITDGNIFVEKAVSLIDGIDLYKGDNSSVNTLSGYDLYIFDGVLPEMIPADGQLWILNPPAENPFMEIMAPAEVENMYFTGTFGDNIDKLDFYSDKIPAGTTPLWAGTVLGSDRGALAVFGEWNGQKTCIFTFDIHDTQLPLMKEFPILTYNIVTTLLPQRTGDTAGYFAGETTNISLLPRAVSGVITAPDGKETKADPSKGIQNTYYETGLYKLTQVFDDGEREETFFAVNPVTIGESDLQRGISEEGNTQKGGIRTGKSLTSVFLMLLLAVLAVEWWVNWHER